MTAERTRQETMGWIADWQCKMFIYASALYYQKNLSVWSDEMFDDHCRILLVIWEHCPRWFKQRVTQEDLKAGTGFALKYTDDEIESALSWYTYVQTLKPRTKS